MREHSEKLLQRNKFFTIHENSSTAQYSTVNDFKSLKVKHRLESEILE